MTQIVCPLLNKTTQVLLFMLTVVPAFSQSQNVGVKKKNVLFIVVDDLRPELGCYGAAYMKTPNIDKLADEGILFENAYCQQALCAPSRNSVMTGLRPEVLDIYDLGTFFRKNMPDIITLPQYFKNNGYTSEGVGKIYHDGHGNHNDTASWSTFWNYKSRLNTVEKVTRGDTTGLESNFPKIGDKMLPYYKTDAPENQMTDAIVAQIATERMHILKDLPFFLAVGFKLPHLPFVAPRKYWDIYDPASIKVPRKSEPENVSKYALLKWSGELEKYHGIEPYKQSGYVPDDIARNLIHGYYACVSEIDAMVGKLMNTLDELRLRDNTVVILWGDHGWKLGEYGTWAKHSNIELDTRVPLIISAPFFPKGQKTHSLAELIDIYPTLCELIGLDNLDHLQGKSLVRILENPATHLKQVAMSQYPRGKALENDKTKQQIMGYTITDGRYRFTRWQSYEKPEKIIDRELYDHASGRIDLQNLAGEKKYTPVMKRMEKLLEETIREGKASIYYKKGTKAK